MKYSHLFGPVPSRRLGLSLGVDLVPHKTCSLNCIYCECGATTILTDVRKEYVPVKAVIAELDDYLAASPGLDYVTFSGSGEPTLNSGLDMVVDFLKEYHPGYKLCLLTNGTLFAGEKVRSAVSRIDLIIPSLDAAGEETFQKINRPCNDLRCADIIEGLIALRREYAGNIVLEIFIVPGLNDTAEELSLIKGAIKKINPERVQIGTLDRPGTEDWVAAADTGKMKEIAGYLDNAEVIGDFHSGQPVSSFNDSTSRMILQTLRRRPCTISDLTNILALRPAEIQKYINQLLAQEKIDAEQKERGIFLKIRNGYGGFA